MINFRDQDIINAITEELLALNVFDGVFEFHPTASQTAPLSRYAFIEVVTQTTDAQWDSHIEGSAIVTLTLKFSVVVREEDDLLRNRRVGMLYSYIQDTVNGSTLGGWIMPAFSLLTKIKFAKPNPPVQEADCLFTCQYLTDSLQSFNTVE